MANIYLIVQLFAFDGESEQRILVLIEVTGVPAVILCTYDSYIHLATNIVVLISMGLDVLFFLQKMTNPKQDWIQSS